MKIKTLREKVRRLGFQLAVREIYGENTPSYHDLKWDHHRMLAQLYKMEKRLN